MPRQTIIHATPEMSVGDLYAYDIDGWVTPRRGAERCSWWEVGCGTRSIIFPLASIAINAKWLLWKFDGKRHTERDIQEEADLFPYATKPHSLQHNTVHELVQFVADERRGSRPRYIDAAVGFAMQEYIRMMRGERNQEAGDNEVSLTPQGIKNGSLRMKTAYVAPSNTTTIIDALHEKLRRGSTT